MFSSLGDKRTGDDRFGPLEMTSKIHRKISKFGAQAPIVEKALSSFENFYKAANQLDDDLVRQHGSNVAAQVKRKDFVEILIRTKHFFGFFSSGRCSGSDDDR